MESSKAVGANGEPMVVYHGGMKWDTADLSERGALWLTDDAGTAIGYADQYSPRNNESEV